jgi:hypothetical protein
MTKRATEKSAVCVATATVLNGAAPSGRTKKRPGMSNKNKRAGMTKFASG